MTQLLIHVLATFTLVLGAPPPTEGGGVLRPWCPAPGRIEAISDECGNVFGYLCVGGPANNSFRQVASPCD